MRGTGHAAVVLHRKCPVTKQMRQARLARRVKKADFRQDLMKGFNELNFFTYAIKKPLKS